MTRLLLLLLLLPVSSFGQEMRFVVEQSCLATGAGVNFKCDSKSGEFFITKSGSQFSGVHPDGGPKQSLSIVKSTPYIVVLD